MSRPKRNAVLFVGKRFGRLVVLSEISPIRNSTSVLCKCDCGNNTNAILSELLVKKRISCGCAKDGNPIHGLSGTSEYEAWLDAKHRCMNPSNHNYKNYGARGIKMADEWINNYPKFLLHVGKKPSPELSLDRINNNGNYEPGNVRWTTQKIQIRNSRRYERVS